MDSKSLKSRWALNPKLESAVSAAAEAFQSWSKTPPVVRARVLFRFRDLIESHRDDLAQSITTQHGKVLSDAQGEITRGLEVVEFACGIPHAKRENFLSMLAVK